MKEKAKLKFISLIVFLGLTIFVVYFFDLQIYLSIEFLEEKIEAFGFFAPLVYIILYAILTILFFPGSLLSIAGGILFGQFYGVLYIILGAMLGAGLAFLISRYFGREFFAKILKKRFKRIFDYNNKLEKDGLWPVVLIRMIPVLPFNGTNYAFGITKVSFKNYMLGTVLGILPASLVYAFLGDSIATLSVVQLSIAAVVFILFTVIVYLARNKIKINGEKKS